MKKIAIGIIAFILVTSSMIFVFGQNRDGSGKGFGGKHSFGPPFLSEKFAKELGLNEEQKTQIKQIHDTEKPNIQALMEAGKGIHSQLEKLGTDGVYNESQVAELAAQQAENAKQLIIAKEKTKAAVFAVLTPEQRTKAEQMRDQFKNKFGKRFGKGRFGKGGFSGEEANNEE